MRYIKVITIDNTEEIIFIDKMVRIQPPNPPGKNLPEAYTNIILVNNDCIAVLDSPEEILMKIKSLYKPPFRRDYDNRFSNEGYNNNNNNRWRNNSY